MLKRELLGHFLITLIWLALVTLLRWQWGFYLIFFWLGGILGTMLLDLDQLLYATVIYSEELTSLRVKRVLKERHLREAIGILAETAGERTRLAFHNAAFQIFFAIFCFWVLTSTGSWLVKGMVMAAGLHLLKDEIGLLARGKGEWLQRLLFWPIGKEISLRLQTFFVVAMLLIFLGLSLLLV